MTIGEPNYKIIWGDTTGTAGPPPTITTVTGTSTIWNAPFTAPPPRDFRQITSMSDLDHVVFKTPIEDLVNMWLARFGREWVDKQEVLDDEFFEWVALRLRGVARLEEHVIWNDRPVNSVPNGPKTVLRVVDK